MSLRAALTRRSGLALVAACLLTLALTGCGGLLPQAAEPTSSSQPALGIKAPPIPADAVSFAAPSGAFTVAIPGTWRLPKKKVEVAEAVWFTQRGADDFDPNVNVLVEQLAGSMTIDEYLELSVANGPTLVNGFQLLDARQVRLTNGELGGRFEYSGEFREKAFRFLAIISIDDTVAAVATYTDIASAYEKSASAIEPYLLTLSADSEALSEREKNAAAKKKAKKQKKKRAKKQTPSAN